MKIKLWDIFKVFTKIGLILIGGGYVIIPLLKDELIDKRNWITEKELVDYFALSHTLPGLIAGNIAIFIGYKLRGKWGGLMAMLGISTGPFVCIAAIMPIIALITTSHTMKSIFWGVDIGVIIMIIAAVKEMWSSSVFDKFTTFLYIISLFLILKFKLSPTTIVISSILIGIIYKRFINKDSGETSK